MDHEKLARIQEADELLLNGCEVEWVVAHCELTVEEVLERQKVLRALGLFKARGIE